MTLPITYTCAPIDPAVKVRLVNGSGPDEGRVEIEYDGVNGTVCDNNWSRYDARALCHQLGYRDGDARLRSHFGPGKGPVLMDGMRCRSNDPNIFACTNNGWKQPNFGCGSHTRDASAVCYVSGNYFVFILIL